MNDPKIARQYLNKKMKAEHAGYEFTLSFTAYKNLRRAKRCYYTGIALTEPVDGSRHPTDRTIDRKDHRKGYISGNVVACCDAVNQLKSCIESRTPLITMKLLERMLRRMNK